jgi:hypothetical protein
MSSKRLSRTLAAFGLVAMLALPVAIAQAAPAPSSSQAQFLARSQAAFYTMKEEKLAQADRSAAVRSLTASAKRAPTRAALSYEEFKLLQAELMADR